MLIRETLQHIGSDITIAGQIEARRDMGKIIFLDIRDRSDVLQVVCAGGVTVSGRAGIDCKSLRPGFALRITGPIKERGAKAVNPKLATGKIEMDAKQIEVLAVADPLPFDLGGEIAIDTYLDHLPYTLRTPKARAIFKIQTELLEGFRQALRTREFVEFQAPKIVGGATEGGANVFTIDYFDKKAFLAQSPQFYKQIMVGIFERVFTCGNVYRAELHATSRHVNEYTSLDLEFGYIEDHRDVMRMERDVLADTMAHVAATCGHYFSPSVRGGGDQEGVGAALFGTTIPVVPPEIPSLKLREAQAILEKEFGLTCLGEPDLEPDHERKLCEWAAKHHGSDFLFVTHFPISKRPFYTMPDPADPDYARGFDLLFRGVEITTGSQRIHDYQQLLASATSHGLNPDNFRFYFEAFKVGMPPEGGLAIGLERLTQKLLGLENVKEATLFPRDIGRIDERLASS